METDDSVRIEAARRSVRRVRRVAGGRLPFVPHGLVPAIGLVLVLAVGLIPFAQAGVEDVAERAARQSLLEVGADWASATASGQWVVLDGAPPSAAAAEEAFAAVLNARAPALLGMATPITRVTERFVWTGATRDPTPVVDAASQPEAPDAPEAETATSRPPPSPEIVLCETRLASLLSTARIEFATGSSVIRTQSASILDAVAATALTCPGVLRVEGHTDNVGGSDMNRELSLQRAEAVRAALIRRGLPASRLVAEGFGDTAPTASNATEDGRSRNRRIEIRVIDAPTDF